MKKSLIWGIVIVAIIIVAGFMYNSTMTGNVVSGQTTVMEGETINIVLDEVTYSVTSVSVNKVEWATFTIVNMGTGESQVFEGDKDMTLSATTIGLKKIHLDSALYGPNRDGESSIRVTLYG